MGKLPLHPCYRRWYADPYEAVQVVVDAQGRLAGVLSRGDVLRAVINNFNIYMRSMDS